MGNRPTRPIAQTAARILWGIYTVIDRRISRVVPRRVSYVLTTLIVGYLLIVIVNGVLQDTDRPLMFLRESEETRLKPGALIVDVSCDQAMGFPFARPTSFEAPTFTVGRVTYYGVDHTPSYLWQSASWEISRVVAPFVTTVLGGPATWDGNETIRRAIEIREGVVRNETILSFQNRETDYPHRIMSA